MGRRFESSHPDQRCLETSAPAAILLIQQGLTLQGSRVSKTCEQPAELHQGRYHVRIGAREGMAGSFIGAASIVWDDDELSATVNEGWRFHKPCDTPEQAEAHARSQVARLL